MIWSELEAVGDALGRGDFGEAFWGAIKMPFARFQLLRDGLCDAFDTC